MHCQEQPLLLDVYNIEVEDFHTYYVGNLGLWAHNAYDIRNHLNKFKIQFSEAARSVQEALSFKTLWTKYEASVYALERGAGEILGHAPHRGHGHAPGQTPGSGLPFNHSPAMK
ncbi:MAG TPA: hypothetical protein PJ981_13240 [Accumulibacter sp.]|nr:hypothetical protein [Accumulibacter sp.]